MESRISIFHLESRLSVLIEIFSIAHATRLVPAETPRYSEQLLYRVRMIPRSWDVHQGISEAEGVGFGWRRVAQCCSSGGGGGGAT